MFKNESLNSSKKAKFDEFYTRLSDVELELVHYKAHFKDKVVLMNCDNPERSNFWAYFKDNFETLGLRRIICTHYSINEPTYILEYDGRDFVKTPLKGNGDFRSPECIAILKGADIVVTNPPFSLFREYISKLVEHNKGFLILGTANAITYKELFPLIKDNKMWLGYLNKATAFDVPNDYDAKGVEVDINGNKFVKLGFITWFTNLSHDKRNQPIELKVKYDAAFYPKYDGYDAIEVNKVAKIPMDYMGIMGVPITFLDKYCPAQFEILGLDDHRVESKGRGPEINGKAVYRRIIIQRKGV